MKRILFLFWSVMAAAGLGPATLGIAAPRVDIANEEIFEVLRYLYRWHLDAWVYIEDELPDEGVVLLRELSVEHDEGDTSRYVELVFPTIYVRVILKKADYEVPELGVAVRNDQFKVSAVERSREPLTIEEPDVYEHRNLQVADLFDYLHETRNVRIFPDEKLRRRLGDSLINYLDKLSPAERPEVDLEGDEQVFYLASLSPVSNDLWVFWENARRLIKFASDADYDSEAFWILGPLDLEVLDLDRDVVVTLDEIDESAKAVTKDWVGRTLFNCIVLGQKITVPPGEARRRSDSPEGP